MRSETFSCDECGVLRKDANHWFIALIDGAKLLFFAWGDGLFLKEAKHLCGQKCAQKLLDRWMSTGKI